MRESVCNAYAGCKLIARRSEVDRPHRAHLGATGAVAAALRRQRFAVEGGDGGRKPPVDDVEDVAFAMPVGIRDLLNGASGAVSGHLDSDPRIRHYDEYYYRFFAQVTPFQVHVKLGHFNSLVWVTDLATGKPVADAHV